MTRSRKVRRVPVTFGKRKMKGGVKGIIGITGTIRRRKHHSVV